MRIYLDNCCIQRPLDDKTQIRVAVESEMIMGIISLVEAGKIRLISSEILEFEVSKSTNIFRKHFASEVLGKSEEFVKLNDDIENRAKDFIRIGISPMDALHLASAEEKEADFLCTCDDAFLKKSRKIRNLGTKVVSPLELLKEI